MHHILCNLDMELIGCPAPLIRPLKQRCIARKHFFTIVKVRRRRMMEVSLRGI